MEGCKTGIVLNQSSPKKDNSSITENPIVLMNKTQQNITALNQISNETMCYEDSDCVIKNVGNCCGAYPRCTTKQFIPPKLNCTGKSGLCGFPVIEKCKCINSFCESFQMGNKI